MARGRMIAKCLSTSERRAALHLEAGKLAEFCQGLYPLLLAHADDWGCQHGDVFTIKHLVDPTSPRRLTDFEAALVALHNVGLITWFQDAETEKWWIYIRGWFTHQNLHGNEKRKRDSPAPPENPSKLATPAQIRSDVLNPALRELKRTELKGTEPTVGSGADAPAGDVEDRDRENVQIAGFVARFCELFSKYRHGAKYSVQRQKDIPTVRRLLCTYPRDELEAMAVILLTTDDDWISKTDRGIGILSIKASKLADLLAEHRAKRRASA